jgi:hypothetical protein
MTKRKPPPWVLGGIRIISTVFMPTHDPKEALKEANANRLARAKFDQAMATNDLVVRHAMLKSVEDDGTAGAALLRYARDVLEAKKRKEVLHANNESKERTRDVKGKRHCAVADAIRAEDPAQGRTLFGLARATSVKLLQERGEEVSTKTIERALKRRAASLKK